MQQEYYCPALGKTKHATRGDANRERDNSKNSHRRKGVGRVKIEVYRCPTCNFWHVGHHAKPQGRPR